MSNIKVHNTHLKQLSQFTKLDMENAIKQALYNEIIINNPANRVSVNIMELNCYIAIELDHVKDLDLPQYQIQKIIHFPNISKILKGIIIEHKKIQVGINENITSMETGYTAGVVIVQIPIYSYSMIMNMEDAAGKYLSKRD